jgi:holo-[acyl-carrier protein] synthase
MIIGIGVDIVEIRRIKEAVARNDSFIEKLFSKEEIEYFQSRNMRPEYIAGRFAAKEAVSKALGTGFRGFGMKDIVIDRTTLGKPIVVLKGKAKLLAQKSGSCSFHLSISHSQDNAIAYVIMEKNSDKGEEIESNNSSDDEGN